MERVEVDGADMQADPRQEGEAPQRVAELGRRAAYLSGLVDRLGIGTATPEGRVLRSIVDLVGQMAEHLQEIQRQHDGLASFVGEVDCDLTALEDAVFAEDGEETVAYVTCPACGETVEVPPEYFERQGEELELVCPSCGQTIPDLPEEFEFTAEAGEFPEEDGAPPA